MVFQSHQFWGLFAARPNLAGKISDFFLMIQHNYSLDLPFQVAIVISQDDELPTRELTYPTWGIGKSSSQVPLKWDMLVPRRVPSLGSGRSQPKPSFLTVKSVNLGRGVRPKVDPSNQNLPWQVAPVQRHKASANARLHVVLAPDIARVGASLVQKKTTPPSLHPHHPTKTVKLSRIHQRSHQTCRHSGSCFLSFPKKKTKLWPPHVAPPARVASDCCDRGVWRDAATLRVRQGPGLVEPPEGQPVERWDPQKTQL